MAQSLVLAIEPDLRQAAIVKRIVKDKGLANVTVVDSRDAAIEAIRAAIPDVLLLSALLSPRDEDELMAHLRTLENAGHIQTHTIPQLASALEPGEGRSGGGLFSAFSKKKKKKEPEPASGGCEPDLFAEEIRLFLQQAADKKRELESTPRPIVDVRSGSAHQAKAANSAPQDTDAAAAAAGSAWSSPFEWKPAGERAVTQQPLRDQPEMPFVPPPPIEPVTMEAIPLGPVETAPLIVPPAPAVTVGEPLIFRPGESPAIVEPLIAPEPIVRAEPLVMPEPQPIVEPEPVFEPEAVAAAPAVLAEPEPVVEAPAAVVADAPEPVIEDEWTLNARDAKINDRLGPLVRWARKESKSKSKSTTVTGDDVRALIGSLSVPPAVASVTYAKGCRIRRVRVPPAGASKSDSVGAVILSRRLLAERRERRPSA